LGFRILLQQLHFLCRQTHNISASQFIGAEKRKRHYRYLSLEFRILCERDGLLKYYSEEEDSLETEL
jgi:hypothetical protein